MITKIRIWDDICNRSLEKSDKKELVFEGFVYPLLGLLLICLLICILGQCMG